MFQILKDPECCRILREHKGLGYIRTPESPGYEAPLSTLQTVSFGLALIGPLGADGSVPTPEPVILETDAEREAREDRVFRERIARFVTSN